MRLKIALANADQVTFCTKTSTFFRLQKINAVTFYGLLYGEILHNTTLCDGGNAQISDVLIDLLLIFKKI